LNKAFTEGDFNNTKRKIKNENEIQERDHEQSRREETGMKVRTVVNRP